MLGSLAQEEEEGWAAGVVGAMVGIGGRKGSRLVVVVVGEVIRCFERLIDGRLNEMYMTSQSWGTAPFSLLFSFLLLWKERGSPLTFRVCASHTPPSIALVRAGPLAKENYVVPFETASWLQLIFYP